jgi:hypothetical protein
VIVITERTIKLVQHVDDPGEQPYAFVHACAVRSRRADRDSRVLCSVSSRSLSVGLCALADSKFLEKTAAKAGLEGWVARLDAEPNYN